MTKYNIGKLIGSMEVISMKATNSLYGELRGFKMKPDKMRNLSSEMHDYSAAVIDKLGTMSELEWTASGNAVVLCCDEIAFGRAIELANAWYKRYVKSGYSGPVTAFIHERLISFMRKAVETIEVED